MTRRIETSLRTQLAETVQFTASHAELAAVDDRSLVWLATGAVLMVQQAATLALDAAGSELPAMPGPAELLARVSDPEFLPQPYTLVLREAGHAAFRGLVAERNGFMHPRAGRLVLDGAAIGEGVLVSETAVRHLVITQPRFTGLDARSELARLDGPLRQIASAPEFWL